jgi:pimeloyl-ACP methyl ester carboxylesterase
MKGFRWLLLVGLAFNLTGCGTIAAHALVHAPNRYPSWFAPQPPVMLALSPDFFTNFPVHFVAVGPPRAKLCYRIIDPADYHLKISTTNWVEHGKKQFEFGFHAIIPGQMNVWTTAPRGTVILLHGYALAQFAMTPWGVRLAEDGWRCVLVDLRGHGKSTGHSIYFGIKETTDLIQLLDKLDHDHQLAGPVSVMGESYGAALALRLKGLDPRIHSVVAIAPYASLSNAVMNIRNDYASWFPKWWLRSGIEDLPYVLQVPAAELDTSTVLKRRPVPALFVAGSDDHIAPVAVVQQLKALASPESELVVVSDATHESLTYAFEDLVAPILAWLAKDHP